MITPQMKAEDVEKLAKSLDLNLKSGNSETIASMLSEIRQNVYRKASALNKKYASPPFTSTLVEECG